MTNKSKLPRLPIGIAGAVIALVIVYLFTGFPITLIPVNADLQQDLLDDINNNPPPDFQIPINCILVQDCVDNFDEPSSPIDDILNDCDQTPIPNTEFVLEECNDEVFDPIDNMTKTIGDDGTVEDQPTMLPPIMMPPEPEPELFDLSISSIIFKTDNNGTLTESTTNFAVPLFAFFVEDTSNLDFDNGFIQQELVVNAPPNTPITLDADFDVLIGNQTILLEPLRISTSGMTDQNGELKIDYVNSAGLKSADYLFSFTMNLDKFPITGNEKVEFVIKNVRVTSGDFEFVLDSEVIYSIVVATDLNQLIIEDEFGKRLRIFPTDDTLRIYSTQSSFTVARNCVPRRICSPAYTACCYVAPAMGGGTVTHILADGSEMVIANFNSNTVGGCVVIPFTGGKLNCTNSQKVNMQIQRNEIYRIDFTSPTVASITFKTPMEREAFTFYCKGISTTSTDGKGYCNFLQPSVQQALADTLVTP